VLRIRPSVQLNLKSDHRQNRRIAHVETLLASRNWQLTIEPDQIHKG
jgi:hypothetical protein